MKKLAGSILLSLIMLPVAAVAAPGQVGHAEGASGCGWGALLFDGNSGVAAHSAAMTTNASFSNDVFGVSSGTNGCSANAPIKYKGGHLYIAANMTKLAQDMSRGEGETLAGLSDAMGISVSDQPAFNQAVKQNFSRIYPDAEVSSEQVMAALLEVMQADPALAHYANS